MTPNENAIVSEETRERLTTIADALIPEAHGMPGARSIDVGGAQLDIVLRSRPDVAALIERGLGDRVIDDPLAARAEIEAEDPEAHGALLLAIVAGYYMHPEVKALIGYPGQVAKDAQMLGEWEMFQEGLPEMLEEVLARGPVYRPTPETE